MRVRLTVVPGVSFHFIGQPVRQLADKALVQRVIQRAKHIRPGVSVVLNQLLLHVFRLGTAPQKFHGLLQADLRALHKAGKEQLLGHRAGQLCLVRVDLIRAVQRQRAESFAGGDHPVRQHIPQRLSVRPVQRQHHAAELSALHQLRPEAVDGDIQRQPEKDFLPGQILILQALQQHFPVHGHARSSLQARRPGGLPPDGFSCTGTAPCRSNAIA